MQFLFSVLCILLSFFNSTYSILSHSHSILSQNALTMKSVFVRHVSHEIRTPLNTTVMGLELSKQELHPDKKDKRDESYLLDLLSDLNCACNVAVEILNELLLYEKIDGGLVSLETSEQSAWDFVVDVLKVFRIQVRE